MGSRCEVRLISYELLQHTPSSFVLGTAFGAMLSFLDDFFSVPGPPKAAPEGTGNHRRADCNMLATNSYV